MGLVDGVSPLYIVMAGFNSDAETVNFLWQFQHLITISLSLLICGYLVIVSIEQCIAYFFV